MRSQPHDRFPTTRWHLLSKVSSGDAAGRRQALGELLHLYSAPIRRFVESRRGVRPHEVEDIVHDFLTLKWLEQDFLARATPERGRFRWFLTVSLGRFVSNWLRDAKARRHQGDETVGELADAEPPADEFERDWARLVLDQAIERFRLECRRKNRPDVWDVFASRVLHPCLEGAEAVPYMELVARHGFKSPAQAQNVLITAKRGFLRAIKETIGAYESDPEAQESEVADLLRILQG